MTWMHKSVAAAIAAASPVLLASAAYADPINFTVDAGNSSVTVSNATCPPADSSCSITAQLVPYLANSFSLGQSGQTYEAGFFTITVGGLVGTTATADIAATLAFSAPPGTAISGDATVDYFTIDGVYSGGLLTWSDLPQTVDLTDGSSFTVDFTNIDTQGIGNESGVDYIVQADTVVPEPASIALVLGGLLFLSGVGTRRLRF